TVDLTWSIPSGVVDTFDVYFGTTQNPPLLRANLSGIARSISLSQLDSGTTYYWRVGANSACFSMPSTTPVVSFNTQVACTTPQGVQILFAPASVCTDSTYTNLLYVQYCLVLDRANFSTHQTYHTLIP